MNPTTKSRFELATGARIDQAAWNCDIIAVMAERLRKYLEIAGGSVPEHYAAPRTGEMSLCSLLQEDLDYFAAEVPEVATLRDRVEIFQFHGNTPQATILLPGEEDETAFVGVSTAFVKFLHLFFAKFYSLTQSYREGNLHPDYVEEINKEKWDCLPLFLSILTDGAKYDKLDYDQEIENYTFLYQPYDYCDLVVAARQFGLLHEIAHLHVKENQKYKDIAPFAEEYLADTIAYRWLVEPYLNKTTLTDLERYDLSIRVQAPFYYFTAEHFPFSIHHWDDDKTAVLRRKERDYYCHHPLRREMSLMSNMQYQPVFHRHPEMVDYLFTYISKEHIAHDPNTFFRDKHGPAGLLAFTQNDDELYVVMQSLFMSLADAYHAYSELDYWIAYDHGHCLAWLQKAVYLNQRMANDFGEQEKKETWDHIDRIIKRRMGVMKDYGGLDKVSQEHEALFDQAPIKCYDVAVVGWKRRFGIMQFDIGVVAEAEESKIRAAVNDEERMVASVSQFQEMRGLGGEAPALLLNLSVDFVVGTSAGVFATYLYQLLQSIGAKRIRFADEEIDLIKETVEGAVAEAIARQVEAAAADGEKEDAND